MDFKNLIALKKQNLVGYFLFFHSLNGLMKTEGSHITHNVPSIADGGALYHQSLINNQKFKICTQVQF